MTFSNRLTHLYSVDLIHSDFGLFPVVNFTIGCSNEFGGLEKRVWRRSGCSLHGSVRLGCIGGVVPALLSQPPSDVHLLMGIIFKCPVEAL